MDHHSLLHEIEIHKKTIHHQVKCGILNSIDAANELMMTKKQEYKIKEKLVANYHVSKNGTQRKINFIEERGLYTTFMPDRTRISSKSREDLIDKLMDYYGLSINDRSFKNIFELALEEKAKTENPNPKTITRLKYDFDRFIDDTFAKQDIQNITRVELQEYTQTMVHTLHPTYEAFKKYKGVLNVAFSYALLNGIITVNPVAHIKNKVFQKSCAISDKSPEAKIHSQAELNVIKAEIRKRMHYKSYNGYFINGYAMLFSIESGARCGEICALKWEDVKEDYIQIHAQQLKERGDHGSIYHYAPYTKNEKGISKGGRKFPLTNNLRALLGELKRLQEGLGIHSEYIFCHEDGEWIKTDAYQTCLRRLCQSLNMDVTNNHAFRMSLNSNVFIPAGLPATERARLLGHSVETNLKYYSFAGKNNLQNICDLLNDIA